MTLPAALAPLGAYRQFLIVQLSPDTDRPGKTHKHPLNPNTLYRANAHNPASWLSYDEAAARVAGLGAGYMLGFVVTKSDPFFFVDIDNCLTPTGWSAQALELCALTPGAAVEISQSGQGLHIIGSGGPYPPHSCAPDGPDLGFYTEGRFIALTCAQAVGDASAKPDLTRLINERFPPKAGDDGKAPEWTTAPVAEWHGPADDATLISKALASGSAGSVFGGRASFADLWTANAEALGRTWPDGPQGRAWEATAADAALASHLAFWTGKNCARMLELMNKSALVRPKWEKRPDYLEETILYAAGRCSKVLGQDRAAAAGTSANAAPAAINSVAGGAPGPAAGLTFTAAAGGLIAATVANVEQALLSDESGVTIAIDEFRNRLCIRQGETWRLFKDTDYGHLRAALERRGFKPVPSEVIKTVVGMVGAQRAFDSAKDQVNALVWDGVPRVTTALSRYYGVEDTPYTRAASEYLFTALPGRTLLPGCQADMAVILVGVQGARKTSAVSALALDADNFGSVNLSQQDVELAKKLRGKTVLEWAELRGLRTRDQDSIKDWITNRKEEFRDAYAIFPEPYQRRCIVVGTANETEILDDPTGERRWLPVTAGLADVEALERDISQLWAEGAAMWRTGGIRWYEAERLAKEEHHKFKVHDGWRTEIERWLVSLPVPGFGQTASKVVNGDAPFSMIRLLREAVNVTSDRASMAEQHRAGKLLKSLGYANRVVRHEGVICKLWTKVT